MANEQELVAPVADSGEGEAPLISDEEKQIYIKGREGEVLADTEDVGVLAERVVECAQRIAATLESGDEFTVKFYARKPGTSITLKVALSTVPILKKLRTMDAIILGHVYQFTKH